MATVNDLIEQLESQDYDYYLDMMLDSVPEDIDTREGSVIYDALAPAATALAEQALNMADIVRQTYISTADGQFLDYRAAEHGTARIKATKAQVRATATDETGAALTTVRVGDQFSSIGAEPITYTVQSVEDDHSFIMASNTAGTSANSYTGQILPITPNDALNYAEITAVTVPARDDEDDETLRSRLLQATPWLAYGGNIADYQAMLADIPEVGAAQIYPTWAGGGTVKLVIVGTDYLPASASLISEVKEKIDPVPGQGVGLAPIDHTVTVVAPTPKTLGVSISVDVDTGHTKSGLKPAITNTIEAYFANQRKAWGIVNQTTGRGYAVKMVRAQILARVLAVNGVVNAQMPTFVGYSGDVELTFNSTVSELPLLGTVTVS